jgi:MYXO-CTERM domain-containing protein
MGFKTCLGATALVAGLFVSTTSAQIISQAPNQTNTFGSDTTFPQSNADDFIVDAGGASLGVLTWYGTYGNNNFALNDLFTIRIHGDAAGLPDGGAGFLNLSGLAAVTRVDTGTDLFGSFDEFRYTYDLGGLNLGGGTYWIEIFNDTAQNTDGWFWERGDLDAVHGRAGFAHAFETPGVNWSEFPGLDLAFTIEAVPAPGALVLLGLAGCAGVRRRRS